MPECDQQPADLDLARAAASGDGAAFATLVDRHLGTVYGVILRIVCNRADAEDLAQDTFVRAFEKLDQYGTSFPFRNWLLKIATNLAINHLRARRRERARYPRIAETMLETAEANMTGTIETGSLNWGRWLGQLDEAQRAAIVLFHFQGLSYLEVADSMGVPLNTVRTHLHRGRRRLRDLMSSNPLSEGASCSVAMLNS